MDAARRSADDWNALCSHRSALERIARPRVPCPSDVDDVVQEALLRAAESAHVRVHEAGPWLTRVVVNLCHDLHRRPDAVDLADVELPSPRDPVEEVAVVRDDLRRVRARFARLPARQQTAVALRSEGHDVAHVAQALGTSYKTAESLLSRARTTLRGPLVLLGALGLALRRAGRVAPAGLALTVTGFAATVALPLTERFAPTAREGSAPTVVQLREAPAVVVRPLVGVPAGARPAEPLSRAQRPAPAGVRPQVALAPGLVRVRPTVPASDAPLPSAPRSRVRTPRPGAG